MDGRFIGAVVEIITVALMIVGIVLGVCRDIAWGGNKRLVRVRQVQVVEEVMEKVVAAIRELGVCYVAASFRVRVREWRIGSKPYV